MYKSCVLVFSCVTHPQTGCFWLSFLKIWSRNDLGLLLIFLWTTEHISPCGQDPWLKFCTLLSNKFQAVPAGDALALGEYSGHIQASPAISPISPVGSLQIFGAGVSPLCLALPGQGWDNSSAHLCSWWLYLCCFWSWVCFIVGKKEKVWLFLPSKSRAVPKPSHISVANKH